MYKRDYLKDQVEQTARNISIMLSKLMGLNFISQEMATEVEKEISGMTGIEIGKIIELNIDELDKYLQNTSFFPEYLKQVSNYLFTLANTDSYFTDITRSDLLRKILIIDDVTSKKFGTYDYESLDKKRLINDLLEQV